MEKRRASLIEKLRRHDNETIVRLLEKNGFQEYITPNNHPRAYQFDIEGKRYSATLSVDYGLSGCSIYDMANYNLIISKGENEKRIVYTLVKINGNPHDEVDEFKVDNFDENWQRVCCMLKKEGDRNHDICKKADDQFNMYKDLMDKENQKRIEREKVEREQKIAEQNKRDLALLD